MKSNQEEWRPVVGYEDYYEVSNLGRVKRCGADKVRKLCTNMHGYPFVGFTVAGRRYKSRTVHQLVLEAFVGPRPEGLVACHNDGNPANNSVENLRWDTQSNNIRDSVAHGTHSEARKTHCKWGHEFTPENTMFRATGTRYCRQCANAWHRRNYKPKPGGYGPTKTHCKHGHEYTPENTYVSPGGVRDCRTCRQARIKAFRRRSAA